MLTSFWLLDRKKKVSEEDIREAISGNLGRCTGYESIVDSIEEAQRNLEKEGGYTEEEIPVRRGR